MRLEKKTFFQDFLLTSSTEKPISSLFRRPHATVKRGELKVNSIFLIFFNGAVSTGDALLKKCFLLNLWINRKTPLSKFLIFNKVQVQDLQLYEKRDSETDFSLVIL